MDDRAHPDDGSHSVQLLRAGAIVATFSLDEFATLSATEYVVEDAIEVAEGLSQYGDNIEEALENVEEEYGDQEDREDQDDEAPKALPVKPPDREQPSLDKKLPLDSSTAAIERDS